LRETAYSSASYVKTFFAILLKSAHSKTIIKLCNERIKVEVTHPENNVKFNYNDGTFHYKQRANCTVYYIIQTAGWIKKSESLRFHVR